MRAAETNSLPEEIVTTPEGFEACVDELRRLSWSIEGSSFFSSPDWLLAWWQSVAPSSPAHIPIWRDAGGRPVAMAALVSHREMLHPRSSVGVRVWTNLGSGIGAADHCAWPVTPGAERLVADWLERKSPKGSILLRNLDPAVATQLVPAGARVIARSVCPRVSIPGSSEEMVGLAPKFSKHLRSYMRRLEDRGVTFRWIAPETMSEDHLQILFHLHDQRQQMWGVSSTFKRGSMELHRRLIATAAPGRGPAAVVAETDGVAIGILYGFLWRDVFAYYQTGWDPAWAKESIGTALVRRAITLSGAAGARIFDFLRGAEDYKYRFGATDVVDETWLIPSGMSASLLLTKYRIRARVRRIGPDETRERA